MIEEMTLSLVKDLFMSAKDEYLEGESFQLLCPTLPKNSRVVGITLYTCDENGKTVKSNPGFSLASHRPVVVEIEGLDPLLSGVIGIELILSRPH